MSFYRDPYRMTQNWWRRPFIDEPLFPPVFYENRNPYRRNYERCPMRRCPVFTEPETKYSYHHKSVTTQNLNGVVVSEEKETIEHENGDKEEKTVRIVDDKKVTKTKKTDNEGKITENTSYENCNELNFDSEWKAITEN